MSRLHTGSLQPFLRPMAIDEVAPVAPVGLDDSLRLETTVPDGFRWRWPTPACSSGSWPTCSPTRCGIRRSPGRPSCTPS